MSILARTVTRRFCNPAGTITLDETARHRRRWRMVSDNGIAFVLDLPEARRLRHGDGLVLDDGRIIEIVAEPEPLMEVTGRDARHLLALAWQIGNRHLPAEINARALRLRRDHVIRAMLVGLGASVCDVEAPFDPEGGAYDVSSGHRDGGHGQHHHHHHHRPEDEPGHAPSKGHEHD